MNTDEGRGQRRIAIIGTGYSGLCFGIQLQKAGFRNFVMLEKSDRLGGTWRDNTYPGAACDTPAFSYCFSFEQKTDWSRKWVPQAEILAYLDHCARKYDLFSHIRFRTEVRSARFDAGEGIWRIETSQGEEITADVLVSGVGQLNRPYTPDIPGLDRFEGECFHSARWNHDVDLHGKTVAVIGNAASAIQFIPQIAPAVKRLTIFQRSANWMLPRLDRAYSEAEKRRFGRYPLLARLYRWWIWAQHEARFPVFRRNAFLSKRVAALATQNMRAHFSDASFQERLIPDYPVGGKRILISDDYYPALQRDNVSIVPSEIQQLTRTGIETTDGSTYPADVVILATGFKSTEFLVPMSIEGVEGRSLASEWKDAAKAFLGITVAGFPNFFMMYGPNTNLGHNSIIFMLECQTRYIIDCIRALDGRNLQSLDLRQEVMETYNEGLQRELSGTVWAATGKSWYKNEAGKITNNWSGSTVKYWWKTRKADLSLYHQRPR